MKQYESIRNILRYLLGLKITEKLKVHLAVSQDSVCILDAVVLFVVFFFVKKYNAYESKMKGDNQRGW
jgi:hypothetical protein